DTRTAAIASGTLKPPLMSENHRGQNAPMNCQKLAGSRNMIWALLGYFSCASIYPAHAIIQNFFGTIMRKLSVTSSHQVRQFPGTSSRRNLSIAVLKSLKVAEH